MIHLRLRNVTDGVEVHGAIAAEPDHVMTACGLGPLYAAESWTFTNDKVTCKECEQ